jgi:hypothetical protein
MTPVSRIRRLLWLLVWLVVAAVVAPLVILLGAYFQQRTAVEAIRERGGFIIFRSAANDGLLPDVVSVDLSLATVDAELVQTLRQFKSIERVTLDGAKLRPEDFAPLNKLVTLQNLSLARTNITDAGVSQLPLELTNLSLNGTAITDQSMSHVAAMQRLTHLDIANTQISPKGLRQLEPLRSLKKLRIDDSCVTAEIVEFLRTVQPENIEVEMTGNGGRKAFELLTDWDGARISGRSRGGHLMWEVDSPWTHSLAGVVEAVVEEIGLDPPQTAQLVEILGSHAPIDGWGPMVRHPLVSPSAFAFTLFPERAKEIASFDEFIRELQKEWKDVDHDAVRQFAREKFIACDLPKLLDLLRTTENSKQSYAYHYGPILLVLHGIDQPEVQTELDRLLAHDDGFVRLNTVSAFGYGGASLFYSREEWTPNEAADAFAFPRLLRIVQNHEEYEGIRDDSRMVLTEIALRRPEYAAEVLSALVDLLDKNGYWHASHQDVAKSRQIARVDILRLAELAPDAAIAAVPKIREMLGELDKQVSDAPPPAVSNADPNRQGVRLLRTSVLEALSAMARHDPKLAHEVAVEYLRRLEQGQPAGPFDILLSAETPEATRKVILALLETEDAPEQLASLAKTIRDWRVAETATNSRND